MNSILTIWNTYGPYHLARVRGLQEEFTDSVVYCLSHCTSSDEYPFFKEQPPNHTVIVHKPNNKLIFVESLFKTIALLRKLRPDVILTCGYERAETLGAMLYSRCYGAKVVLMLDNQVDDSPRTWIKERIKSIYLKFFDAFLYGGDTHRDYLRHLNVPKEKEAFGYNCVDNDRLFSLANNHRSLGHNPVGAQFFLCVARLIEKKNIPKLIEAYALWRQAMRGAAKWKLVIIGDGPQRAEIEQTIRKNNLQNVVILCGEITRIEVICKYYAFASCFVLASSHNEQWGLVVNEAMACGLPVLVSEKCGCANSLVRSGANGYRLAPESVEQMSLMMQKIVESEQRLFEMGETSRQIIAAYTPRQFAQNIRRLLSI